MPTLYLTEEYALVRRDGEDSLLVQIPEKRAKDGATPSPARKERVPLIKIDEVVVLGEVTLTASAMHLLLERDIEITFWAITASLKAAYHPHFPRMPSCAWRNTGHIRIWPSAVSWQDAS